MDRRTFLTASAGLASALAAGSVLTASTSWAQTPPSSRKESPMPNAQRGQNPGDRTDGRTGGKARVFITGSADGLGHATAKTLLAQGHDVVVHVRSQARLSAVKELVDQGAVATIGDLSDLAQIRDLARQVNAIGPMDAVVHNAGILSGSQVLVVNVVAPYLLTALIQRPKRLIYLSSSMHRGGRASLAGMDWTGRTATGSYSDSKLFVTTLAAAVARRWPESFSNAVDPGWVPTKMGGPGAPDDLRLGHLTQEWLATSNDAEALTSGGYWHHQRHEQPHAAVNDTRFQDLLLAELARATGTALA
ncbi:TPA: SDR family NAD(P)-dependent oxidoreductase [Stenotrophomonas maltophilia]|jgi:NAD(P)-dependent dehydrogenase (short-subunit alcohol dehydrogenase family)|nr:SDR family NAD(P)-dependent oxidoreductase [Stenotrophomonas geniculata]HEL7629141.1 SDR family NAD(P)-dependent oxidoreductase [Stenotrophomonas maltophilia]